MSIQEAIDILTDWDTENIHDPSVGIWRDEDMAKAIPLAIQALNKQIPQKPTVIERWHLCPRCYKEKGFSYDYLVGMQQTMDSKISYCLGCGQAIDWGLE